jgi:hypothetical protein
MLRITTKRRSGIESGDEGNQLSTKIEPWRLRFPSFETGGRSLQVTLKISVGFHFMPGRSYFGVGHRRRGFTGQSRRSDWTGAFSEALR